MIKELDSVVGWRDSPFFNEPTIKDLDRFWSKVEADSIDQCWDWKGGKFSSGYGMYWINNKSIRAHRFAYELEVGKIPEDKVLHHLCENKGCVNVYHLSAVTTREHVIEFSPNHLMYKNVHITHCPQGHEYSEENTFLNNLNSRCCRTCYRERGKKWRDANPNYMREYNKNHRGKK